MKTNGETLFAVANGLLDAVDVGGDRPRLLDTLKLDSGWSHELLLHGDRLLVLSRGGFWAEPLPGVTARLAPFVPSKSVVWEVDVSNPKALRVVRTLTLDGAYVAARLVGKSVRLVASSQVPETLPFEQPATTRPRRARPHASTTAPSSPRRASRAGCRIPDHAARQGAGQVAPARAVQARVVIRRAYSGLGMLTVLTFDLSKGLEPVDSVAVMTDGRIVYASPESLYVATERWNDRPDPSTPKKAQTGVTTELHKFDISNPTKTLYRGSGSVPGFLLSQWSLSEYRASCASSAPRRPRGGAPAARASRS